MLNSRSINRILISVSLCSVIVVRKYVLILFNAENERSHWAVLTASVKLICNNFFSVGNTASSGIISLYTSMTDSILSFCWGPSNVLLANRHSVADLYRDYKTMPRWPSVKDLEKYLMMSLQACTDFIIPMFVELNLRPISVEVNQLLESKYSVSRIGYC